MRITQNLEIFLNRSFYEISRKKRKKISTFKIQKISDLVKNLKVSICHTSKNLKNLA